MSFFVSSDRPNWSQSRLTTSTAVLGLQRRLKLSGVGIGQKWSSGILLASPIASAANQTFASSGPCQVRFLRARRRRRRAANDCLGPRMRVYLPR